MIRQTLHFLMPRCQITFRCTMSSASVPAAPSRQTVAIVGGGIAGLSAASRLKQLGVPYVVFDMGRKGSGGRSCSRFEEKTGLSFDHGAQFFPKPKTEAFTRELRRLIQAGVVAPWDGKIVAIDASTLENMHADSTSDVSSAPPLQPTTTTQPASHQTNVFESILGNASPRRSEYTNDTVYVGVPTMGSVASYMAAELENGASSSPSAGVQAWHVRSACKVTSMQWNSGSRQPWDLRGIDTMATAASSNAASSSKNSADNSITSLGAFDALIIAEQSLCGGLMEASAPSEVRAALRPIRDGDAATAVPLFTLMVAFERPLGTSIPFDGAVVACESGGGAFQWICRDSSKPGRKGGSSSSKSRSSREEGGASGVESLKFEQGSAFENGLAGDGSHSPECWVAVTTQEKTAQLLRKWPLRDAHGSIVPQTRAYREGVAQELLQDFLDVMEQERSKAAAFPSREGNEDARAREEESTATAFEKGSAVLDGGAVPPVAFVGAQRWGRAFVAHPLETRCVAVEGARVAACGDFCNDKEFAPAEAAWWSGRGAAEAVAGWLGRRE